MKINDKDISDVTNCNDNTCEICHPIGVVREELFVASDGEVLKRIRHNSPTTYEREMGDPEVKAAFESADRFNNGKLTYSSLPWKAIREVARVSHMGAEKYGKMNYTKGLNYSNLLDSAMRHLLGDTVKSEDGEPHQGFLTGETIDKESGVHHLAHMAWNILVLLQQELDKERYEKFDDR